MSNVAQFRFNGHRATKQSLHHPDEPAFASTVGLGEWPKGETKALTEEQAAWCRACNARDYEMFTEVKVPEQGKGHKEKVHAERSSSVEMTPPTLTATPETGSPSTTRRSTTRRSSAAKES